MLTGSHEKTSQELSLQIKQDDKFFSRLMSKETSMANSSSRVYYRGASGSVPFTWESQPGTPKHALFNDNTLPPLTPPPSYQSNSSKSNITLQKNSKPIHHLLSYINIPRFIIRSKKNHVSVSPPPPSSWSCTSSLSSCSSSNSTNSKKSKNCRRGRGSPTSNDGRNKWRCLSKCKGCCPMVKMKKALLAVLVGHGSVQGTTA